MDTNQIKDLNRLWTDLRNKSNLKDYEDNTWCENYSEDIYFAFILTWAGWNENRQMNEWRRIETELNKYGGILSEIPDPKAIHYSLNWQNEWFRRLVNYLKSKDITARMFVKQLKGMSHQDAKELLQKIVNTSEDKIVDCWIRDIVRLEAFPIDSRVRKVLKYYQLPDDSTIIVDLCVNQRIPTRVFARAVYDWADELVPTSKVTHTPT